MKNHEDNIARLTTLAEKKGRTIIKDQLEEQCAELAQALAKNNDEDIVDRMARVTSLLVQYRIADPIGSTEIDDIVEKITIEEVEACTS